MVKPSTPKVSHQNWRSRVDILPTASNVTLRGKYSCSRGSRTQFSQSRQALFATSTAYKVRDKSAHDGCKTVREACHSWSCMRPSAYTRFERWSTWEPVMGTRYCETRETKHHEDEEDFRPESMTRNILLEGRSSGSSQMVSSCQRRPKELILAKRVFCIPPLDRGSSTTLLQCSRGL